MRHRHRRVRPSAKRSGPARDCPVTGSGDHTAQVVEEKPGLRAAGEQGRGLRIQIAQQSEARAVARDAPQLFLDPFDGLRHLRRARVDTYREQIGEPADRAGQIIVTVPPMPFDIKQQPAVTDAVANRDGQRGQQNVVDIAMEGGGRGCGQPGRRQGDGEAVRSGYRVQCRVERAAAERPVVRQRLGPVGEFAEQRRFVGAEHLPLRPVAQRGPDRGHVTALPRRPQVRQQHPPGHSVHREVVSDQE
ncbi:hypothetical protein ADK34_08700 [Streptomyces viridochromogenes]|uniref:Uncharacterized protein n=1 Tax=Streptomyces viridochromogenes TaxID=1938 RepID=A0A0L8L3C8_STRVR|nr:MULTISPECIES: hypothetical protein [Streptomyces]KOG32723.1 hypothetical protein ADK34_08700 [Streptomyces viridochromogenes]